MKTFFLFLVTFVTSINIYAQTYQPSKQKLNYLGQDVFLDQHSDFLQDKFILGWHWGGERKISEVMFA